MRIIKPIPESISDSYTCGKCMFLAAAFHYLYGLTIVMETCTDSVGEYIAHAWVLTKDGNALDIDGVCSVEAMGGYGDKIITLDNAEQMRYLMPDCDDTMWYQHIAHASSIIAEYFSE